MKKFIIGFILGAVVFGTSSVIAATVQSIDVTYNNIKISVNGTILQPDVEPFVYMNRTFVPARFIAEALGKDIKYNEVTDTVEIMDKLSVDTTSTGEVIEEPTTTPAPTASPEPTPTRTTYEGCDAVELNGVYYLLLSPAIDKYGIDLHFEAPMITLTKGENSITFSKYDTDYTIRYIGLNFIKLSVLKQIAGE